MIEKENERHQKKREQDAHKRKEEEKQLYVKHHNNKQFQVNGDKDTYCYDASDLLGKGGFGTVYRGKALKTNQKVAIKRLRISKLKASLANSKLFSGGVSIANEIKILKSLSDDPNIVKILDYSVHSSQEHGFIIMEFCDSSLADQIKKVGGVSESRCKQYLQQILSGLARIHNSGMHRDIKPENILLKDGRCKIADFGLALYWPEGKHNCWNAWICCT